MATIHGIRSSRYKVGIQLDPEGNIRSITVDSALECLKRLYIRNSDPNSPDFEALTAIQARALYMILERHGVRIAGREDQEGTWR